MYLFSVLYDQALIPNDTAFGQCNLAVSLSCLHFYFCSSFFLELFTASIIPRDALYCLHNIIREISSLLIW